MIETLASVAFKDIFSEEETPVLSELIKDIPTKSCLIIIAHFMAQVQNKENDFELQKEILFRLVNQQPEDIRKHIFERTKKLIEKHGKKLVIFNNITSLYFYQELLSNYNNEDDRNLTANEELRLIKAYFLVTERWTELEKRHFKGKPNTDDELVAFILPFQMTHNEIQSFKDFRPQLIKALYFFKFIEQDNELSPYLSDFLSQYGLTSWREYLKHTITPYILSSTGTKSTILTFNKTNKVEIEFWETFCIDTDKYSANYDFLELRESPVFKLSEYNYLFYNYNFIIDKLFQSLQFVFSNLLVKKSIVKSFGDFKTKFYSEKFSENFMLYRLIETCISNQKEYISFNGEELEILIGEKGPDYYIRRGNDLIIVEFKDVLMGAKPKTSYDFAAISKEIERKLVANEKGTAKGVGQLAKFIAKIPADGYEFDKVETGKLNIHPVLIVTDPSFTLFGINFLLNNELRKLLYRCKEKTVNYLGLIDLDILLQYQDLLNENEIDLFSLLDAFNGDLEKEKSPYKFKSLGQYFIDFINHYKIECDHMPKFLKDFLANQLTK